VDLVVVLESLALSAVEREHLVKVTLVVRVRHPTTAAAVVVLVLSVKPQM
jgi:hypothetical protein